MDLFSTAPTVFKNDGYFTLLDLYDAYYSFAFASKSETP